MESPDNVGVARMRRYLLLLAVLGCTDPVPVDLEEPDSGTAQPDASDQMPLDAGQMMKADAGQMMAPDAGQMMEPDAGQMMADAGQMTDAGTPCTEAPTTAFEISSSVTFCAGARSLEVDPSTMAAIRVVADEITVTCLGTTFEGASGLGTTAEPTIGFLLQGVQNVQVVGCGVRGFRYGLVAQGSQRITIEGVDFSDNFTDPAADWVQDSVQGGGIRFEETHESVVRDSTFARNWNGIELRSSNDNDVVTNVADHCSNTGATLVNAHRNRLEGNDFSWGIRGDGLSYPNNWYGIDTKDSAGIIVDALSSENEIIDNDTTYGGDGIFIRSVIGGCAPNNLIQGNDTSFSPHNAIECWCDDNKFIDNIASDSHYGIWLGGTDRGLVRGNIVERNIVDGISIQIGEDRHTVIEENRIEGNGRVGILLTGREVQAWHALDRVGPNLANSSHLLIQNNQLASNGPCAPYQNCDVFVASSRGVMLASNCNGVDTVGVTAGSEAEGLWAIGACGVDPSNSPPVAQLADVTASAGTPVMLNASGSTDPDGDNLGYHWLVQRAGVRFVPPALPETALVGSGAAQTQLTFPGAGLWDVTVMVNDGELASGAYTTAAVVPQGLEVGVSAVDWSFTCTDPACITNITADNTYKVSGTTSVQIATDEAFNFAAYTPPGRQAGWDLNTTTRISGFFRAQNRNAYGWQGEWPTFVIGTTGGTITLKPDQNLLPLEATEWIFVDAPLMGGEGWTRTETGSPNLANVDYVEIHTDTWDYGTYYVWVDGLVFY